MNYSFEKRVKDRIKKNEEKKFIIREEDLVSFITFGTSLANLEKNINLSKLSHGVIKVRSFI